MAVRERVALFGVLCILVASPAWATNGHVVHGVGAKNEALGGAGTATEDDLLGSLAWNPAGAHWLDDGVTIDLSITYFRAIRYVESSMAQDTFGPGMPPVGLTGRDRSECPIVFLGAIGIAAKLSEYSPFGIHFGVLGKGGFGIEYDDSQFNPVLTPPAPAGLGFGRIKSDFKLLQLPVGFTWGDGETISIGFSFLPAIETLRVTPAPFGAPDDANGDGFMTYPAARDAAVAFGVGLQVGARFVPLKEPKLALGLSYASPILFEKLKWTVHDEMLARRKIEFQMDFPAIVSFGASLEPLDGMMLALDIRYINYASTDGFSRSGFNPDGSMRGFGWRDIWVFGIGVQQEIGDMVVVRAGYNYCQNPIPDRRSFYNVPAPAVVQHHATVGVTVKVSDFAKVHLTYYHAFENSVSGPYIMPGMGPVPGTNVRNSLAEDAVSLGVTFNF